MDLSLYLVTDRDLSLGRTNEEVVRRALSAGVTTVQYRDKNAPARPMVSEGLVLAAMCREAGVTFIVNDRLDVALICGADGVHLGQDDLGASDARRMAGPDFIIGVSVTTPEEARTARDEGADYLAANGVFPTATKTDLGSPLGLEGVAALAGSTGLPMVAIGGIDASNAGAVVRAGAKGVAVVSFIVSHDDIEGRCAALLESMRSGRSS
ncbi:MAG: thiamine phosphate synthase [bacterium]|nr:MAG: thiamine phosphate synthase [bacterium]